MLSIRVRTIIISDPRATAYIIINILVATAMCFTCACYVYATVSEQRFVCLCCIRACMQQRTMGARGRGWSSKNEQKEKPYLHTEPPYIIWNGYFAIYRVFVSEIFRSVYLLRRYTVLLQLNRSRKNEILRPTNSALMIENIGNLNFINYIYLFMIYDLLVNE